MSAPQLSIKDFTLIPSINEVFAIVALCVVLLIEADEVLGNRDEIDELMHSYSSFRNHEPDCYNH